VTWDSERGKRHSPRHRDRKPGVPDATAGPRHAPAADARRRGPRL